MSIAIDPSRFFRIYALHSPYMFTALAMVTSVGVLTLVLDPSQAVSGLTPLLLLQMFAVSSGFAVPARRGHLDLLLTGGCTRLRIAATHWLVSALPGVMVWVAMGLVELLVSRGNRAAAFSEGSIAALLLVSTFAWALTVRLPRLSGGIVWLLVLITAVAGSSYWSDPIVSAIRSGATWPISSVLFLLCPLAFIGVRLQGIDALAVVPGLALAAVAMALAIRWIVRADIPLEASQ